MEPVHAPAAEHADDFVRELLGAGITLTDLLGTLLDDFEDENPWPGEEPSAVLIEMIAGSGAVAFRSVPPEEVRRASELIRMAVERVIGDLRLALEIGRRRRGEPPA